MAGERTLPGIGLTAFWDLYSDGWKPGMDSNMLLLSALVGRGVKSRTTSLPVSPSLGDIYLVPVGDTNANDLAVWDGSVGLESWSYFSPGVGWEFYVEDDTENVMWDGASWVPDSVGASLFLGTFVDISALTTAHPSPVAGSYAYVDAGAASDIELYIWDDSDGAYVVGSSAGVETAASIKTKYESNADTNAFTDALLAKLTDIEAGATSDQTAVEIEALLDAYYTGTGWRTPGSSVMVQTEITGNHVLTDADLAGNVVRRLNDAAPATVTINTGTTNKQPVTFIQTGAGQYTFVAGVGVTIVSAGGHLSFAETGSFVTLVPDSSTPELFYIAGDLVT